MEPHGKEEYPYQRGDPLPNINVLTGCVVIATVLSFISVEVSDWERAFFDWWLLPYLVANGLFFYAFSKLFVWKGYHWTWALLVLIPFIGWFIYFLMPHRKKRGQEIRDLAKKGHF